FGYEREEVVGRPIHLLVPDWSYQIPRVHDEAPELAVSCGSGRECIAVRHNGDRFPAEITTSLQAEEGILITSAIRDITERKRTERQIRELKAHKELAHALDVTHTMIRNIDGTIRVWTRGAPGIIRMDGGGSRRRGLS
ncbi:MAG: PAS domain S-box protein, partial [Acidobacteriaceae bacterium]|nr:PAS domain S-box protein [Acidobacteriaceae bacterium]